MKQRRKLTIEELNKLPRDMWNLELIQIEMDALAYGPIEIVGLASNLRKQANITAEMIVELRNRLTVEPVPQLHPTAGQPRIERGELGGK